MQDINEGSVERKLVEDFQYLPSDGPSYFPTIWPGESVRDPISSLDVPIFLTVIQSHNLSKDRPMNDHPRLQGDFLWRQLYHAKVKCAANASVLG